MDSNLKNKKTMGYVIVGIILIVLAIFTNYADILDITNEVENITVNNEIDIENNNIINNIDEIPEYSGELIIQINKNIPFFIESDFIEESFIRFSDLDEKGRCGITIANISKDILQDKNEKRDNLDKVIPTGWDGDAEYKDIVPGDKLYNKSHLIAFSLIGRCEENISKNIITGTHDFNTKGMTRYENDITAYFKKKENENNHILYRVTPVFEDDNLVAKGVLMEAESVEDRGQTLKFNVFVYNVQDGIKINYETGESELESK